MVRSAFNFSIVIFDLETVSSHVYTCTSFVASLVCTAKHLVLWLLVWWVFKIPCHNKAFSLKAKFLYTSGKGHVDPLSPLQEILMFLGFAILKLKLFRQILVELGNQTVFLDVVKKSLCHLAQLANLLRPRNHLPRSSKELRMHSVEHALAAHICCGAGTKHLLLECHLKRYCYRLVSLSFCC